MRAGAEVRRGRRRLTRADVSTVIGELSLVGGRGDGVHAAAAASPRRRASDGPARCCVFDSCVDVSSLTLRGRYGLWTGAPERKKYARCDRRLRTFCVQFLALQGTALLQALYLHSFCISGTVHSSASAAAAFQGSGADPACTAASCSAASAVP